MCVLKVVVALPLQGQVVQEADDEVPLLPHFHSCREPAASCAYQQSQAANDDVLTSMFLTRIQCSGHSS